MAVSGDRSPGPSRDAGHTALSAAFGLEIRRSRRKLSLSQEELANRAALDRTTIGRVERGEFRVTLEVAEAMAQACGTSLWQLLQSVAQSTDKIKPKEGSR